MRRIGPVFILVFCLLFAYGSLSAVEEVNQLGMHPFYKSRDLQKEDLLKIATEKAEEVKAGFELAGNPELFEVFIKQLQNADVNLIEVQKGEKISWMIFKKRRKVEIKKDVIWTADTPFKAYQFFLEKDGTKYEFIVPKVCGNISLKSEKVIPPPPPPPPPPPKNKPPICDLKVTPAEILVGQSIILDASHSTDPDGKIASVKFVISGADGTVLEEKELTALPYIYETVIKKVGTCKINVIVTDDEGLTAAGNCEASVSVLKRGFLIADIAVMYQVDPAWFLPIRAGYMHKLSKSFGIIGLVGVAPLIGGNDDVTSFLADLTLTYWPKKFFLGTGVGIFYGKDRPFGDTGDTRIDWIINSGIEIAPHFSLFLEGRIAFDEFDVIDKFGRIGIGFRLKY